MGVAMARPTPGGSTSPATTVAQAPTHGSQDGDTIQQGDQTTPDVAGQDETASKTEPSESSTGAADNPAGHADPAGDVQHNGGSNES